MSSSKYNLFDSHSIDDQSNYLADYLPDDSTFESKMTNGTNFRKMLNVFARRLQIFEESENIYTTEMGADCASQLLFEWERMVGIPDSCFTGTENLETRQRNIVIKLGQMGVQTTQDFIDLALFLGIVATVESGIDSGEVFAGGDNEARFTIVVSYNVLPTDTFTYTFPFTFGNIIIAALQCIFLKVKPANCNLLFIEIVPEVLGDFRWGFGDGVYDTPFYQPAGADWFIMTNAQALSIGDTVTFDYLAMASPQANGVLITSSDGVAFFGWGADLRLASFSGFTAKLNGVTINNGDSLPSQYTNPIPPSTPPEDDGRYQVHRIELTATIVTDIKIIGRDFTQGILQRALMPVNNLTIVTAAQTYQWDMDNTVSAAQPESNVGGNDIIIQSFNSIQWRYVGVIKESINNDDRLDMYMSSFQPNLAETIAGMIQPSLRADGAGNSINFNAMGFGKNLSMANSAFYHLINYAAGFTIELLIVMEAEPTYNSTGGNVGGVGTSDNIVIPIFEMRWDNYAEATATTPILKPCFTLVKRSVNYGNYSQGQTNIEVEVRGTEHPVVGQIYHMLGTLRPSDDTMEFWLDGVSQGTANIPTSWWDNNDQANFGLQNPTGQFRGSYTKLMFAKSAGARTNSSMQDCKIHLLEADQAFATQQYETARVNT